MAKTLRYAIFESNKIPHYLCKCEYCNEDCVIDQPDFDSFNSIPKHEDDESAWKCPNCGHVNIELNENLEKCQCTYDGKLK